MPDHAGLQTAGPWDRSGDLGPRWGGGRRGAGGRRAGAGPAPAVVSGRPRRSAFRRRGGGHGVQSGKRRGGGDIGVLRLAGRAARRPGCPLVIPVHASVRHNMRVTSARTAWLRLAGGLAERRALAAADMVIALTAAAADRLAGEGIPHGRIRVIPPGYDPHLFAAAAPDPFPDLGRPRVGYIGRIAPQKDVGTLISAFGRVTGPACLLIVGDGPGRRAAERQARPLAGPVRFTGFAPHARIPAVLRHIDL